MVNIAAAPLTARRAPIEIGAAMLPDVSGLEVVLLEPEAVDDADEEASEDTEGSEVSDEEEDESEEESEGCEGFSGSVGSSITGSSLTSSRPVTSAAVSP